MSTNQVVSQGIFGFSQGAAFAGVMAAIVSDLEKTAY
jgi:hypothetical protein